MPHHKQTGRKKSKRNPARRLYSAAELAKAMGVHKMTILRYLDNGHLRPPGLFMQMPRYRVSLWTRREFQATLRLLRGEERARKLQQFTKMWLATAGHALRKNEKREIAGVKIIWKRGEKKDL